MPLDLTSLSLAVSALSRSVTAARTFLPTLGPDLQEAVKSGVIQNFEVAYEQCWKFMQRWVRENEGPEAAEAARSRKDLFRVAARLGLIPDPLPWFRFSEARNLTSHTYDAAHATEAYFLAIDFLSHAESLVRELEKRNA